MYIPAAKFPPAESPAIIIFSAFILNTGAIFFKIQLYTYL